MRISIIAEAVSVPGIFPREITFPFEPLESVLHVPLRRIDTVSRAVVVNRDPCEPRVKLSDPVRRIDFT